MSTDRSDYAAFVNDIETFTVDVGPEGEKAWARLRSIPRDELIGRLLTTRSGLPADDSMQPRIAFVLCNLDYEYPSNVSIVASALSQKTKYRDFGADDAAGLIAKLIDRGDKTLLPILLRSADWADGALAETLAGVFSDELRRYPQKFLLELKAESARVRRKVFKLIQDGSLNNEDINRLRQMSLALPSRSPIFHIAHELLNSGALD